MICPYVRFSDSGRLYGNNKLQVSVSEKLYKMVYDCRFDESVTMEQIKETYRQFIDDTKQYVQSFLENTLEWLDGTRKENQRMPRRKETYNGYKPPFTLSAKAVGMIADISAQKERL